MVMMWLAGLASDGVVPGLLRLTVSNLVTAHCGDSRYRLHCSAPHNREVPGSPTFPQCTKAYTEPSHRLCEPSRRPDPFTVADISASGVMREAGNRYFRHRPVDDTLMHGLDLSIYGDKCP